MELAPAPAASRSHLPSGAGALFLDSTDVNEWRVVIRLAGLLVGLLTAAAAAAGSVDAGPGARGVHEAVSATGVTGPSDVGACVEGTVAAEAAEAGAAATGFKDAVKSAAAFLAPAFADFDAAPGVEPFLA